MPYSVSPFQVRPPEGDGLAGAAFAVCACAPTAASENTVPSMQAARGAGCSIEEAARIYFRLGERLSLARLGTAAQKLPREGLWPSQAAISMLDELANLHADLLGSALRSAGPQGCGDPEAALARWTEPRKTALERIDRLHEELAAAGQLDLAMLSVATNELRALV